MITQYSLLINTNKYAGNFERELTAFCTGVNGECGVGDTSQYWADETYDFNNVLDLIADENGCHRPCEIYRLNGKYHSVRIHFYNKPTHEEILIIKRRAETFCQQSSITILNFNILTSQTIEVLSDV